MIIMPTQRTPPADDSQRDDAERLTTGSTALYRDRPTDDGMKGDGADEPNAGSPRLPKQGPSRRAHAESSPSADKSNPAPAESDK
jgi:hypothetical protein